MVVALVLSLGSWTSGLVAQQPEPAPNAPASQALPKPSGTPPSALPPGAPPGVTMLPAVTPSKDARWNVAVDVQMVALPEELTLVFIADFQSGDEAKVEAAVGQLQDLLKKKQAILMGWPWAIGVDGDRIVSETIVEQRYPTEWDPAILVPDPPATPPAAKPESSVSPTGFETRNLGITLEVEPTVLSDGREIVLSLVAQRVSLDEFERFNLGRSKDGQTVHTEQPQFANSKITTTLKVRSGQHVLIGTHLLAKPKNHMEFVIARAVTVKMR